MELKHELFKTVKVYKENWGHTYIYFSYKNHQDIAEIISSMFTKYAECNAHVCKINSSDDFIMGWGELQNQGLIYYSLYEAAGRENRIISEFPYTQNEKRMMEEGDENKQQHKNRIDYHIHDTKKGRVLLVEYKHCCITLDPKNHSEFSDILDIKIKKLFDPALCKFEKAMEKENRDKFLEQCYSNNKRNTYRIVLWMVPLICERKGKKKGEEINPINDEDFKNILHELPGKFDANLSGYWRLPPERQKEPAHWKEEGVETRKYYYGAFLFGSIKSCVK